MGIFSSKSTRSATPTGHGGKADDEHPLTPSTKETKALNGGKTKDDNSTLQISEADEPGGSVSGSHPKSIEDRTRNGEVAAHFHHSCPSTRRFTGNFHHRRSSTCHIPHSSRQAAEDYFSYKHHTGSGISWSDKAYDTIIPEEKKDKK
ncbi:unnamed protein product [Clonostachys solani]|uniref:Uncharacterized protein n=1 Tax=Clonostachys solani TaxID=160281 RepID=A0A9P0EJ78_9HYPO|nr:unnamed protein product [Clonostachys solani]